MGRELLLCDNIDLSGVANSHRAKALTQKIRLLSPFRNTGHYVIESNGAAVVWLWDENRRLELASEADAKLDVIPETLLFPSAVEGKKVLKLAEGFETQFWSGGHLQESVWSRDHSIGEGPDEQNDPKVAWLTEHQASEDSISEELLWRFGAWLMLVLIVFQAGNYLGWLIDERSVRDQIEEANLTAKKVIAFREAAREQLATSTTLREWLNHPSQLGLVAEIDRRMPDGSQLLNWTYQDRRLVVTVTDPNLDNRAYVEQLSASDRFGEVRIEPGTTPDSAKIEVVLVE